MENQTCGSLYLCSKHQTHPFVPELWILASFPNQHYVKTIEQTQEPEQSSSYHWSKFSELNSYERTRAIEECRDLTNQIYNGLNLETEIYSVEKQRLGDTILLREDNKKNG